MVDFHQEEEPQNQNLSLESEVFVSAYEGESKNGGEIHGSSDDSFFTVSELSSKDSDSEEPNELDDNKDYLFSQFLSFEASVTDDFSDNESPLIWEH